MKLKTLQNIANVDGFETLRRFVSQALSDVVTAINGKIAVNENLDGAIGELQFSTANQELAFKHTLNRVATNYIIVGKSANISVFDGITQNDTSTLYLRGSGAGIVRIFVF